MEPGSARWEGEGRSVSGCHAPGPRGSQSTARSQAIEAPSVCYHGHSCTSCWPFLSQAHFVFLLSCFPPSRSGLLFLLPSRTHCLSHFALDSSPTSLCPPPGQESSPSFLDSGLCCSCSLLLLYFALPPPLLCSLFSFFFLVFLLLLTLCSTPPSSCHPLPSSLCTPLSAFLVHNFLSSPPLRLSPPPSPFPTPTPCPLPSRGGQDWRA